MHMLYPEIKNLTVKAYKYHSIPKAKNLSRPIEDRDRTWKKSAGRVQKKAPAISGA